MSYRKILLCAALAGALVGCAGWGDNDYSSGDRVLVSKCAYDTIGEPRRYEVVVFKYPDGPMDRNTPKNYIKRLLGLPGEIITIFFGRLFRWGPGPGEAPPYDDSDKDIVMRTKMFHDNDEPSKKLFETAGKFEILREPPEVMMAMRRIVYDNDYQAKDLKGILDRWSPVTGSPWKNDAGTGFTVTADAKDRLDWLRYQHVTRPEGPIVGGIKIKPRLITDVMGYNSFQVPGFGDNGLQDRTPSPHWTGDLMLECNLEVKEAKGEFWLELSRGIHRFRARFDLSTGNCTLFRSTGVGPDAKVDELATKPTPVHAPGNYLLRFANFNARLTLWVDRAMPFGDGQEYNPPEIRSKDETPDKLSEDALEARRGPTENDLEPASLGSKGAAVRVEHLKLWRNTYYSTSSERTDYDDMMANDSWAEPGQWNTLRKQHYRSLYVQPGHYLCLGDNSAASSDSRYWGLVPHRLMLGRALLVYYPLNRIGPIR
jgi:signal peptidase I